MDINYLDERKEVIEIGLEMVKTNLVVGTWGNISRRIDENLMAITPSGMDYDSLKPEDIVIVDMEGNVVEGDRKPSIEYIMHMEIYKDRDDINGIVHTHSIYCTAFAAARMGIPACLDDLVQIVGGNVRVAKYALPGTMDLAKNVVNALEERNAVILSNHGAVAGGRDLKEALKTALVLEKSAQAAIFAETIGGVVPLRRKEIESMRDFYLNEYGQR